MNQRTENQRTREAGKIRQSMKAKTFEKILGGTELGQAGKTGGDQHKSGRLCPLHTVDTVLSMRS